MACLYSNIGYNRRAAPWCGSTCFLFKLSGGNQLTIKKRQSANSNALGITRHTLRLFAIH
jgi:hypothetical protein